MKQIETAVVRKIAFRSLAVKSLFIIKNTKKEKGG